MVQCFPYSIHPVCMGHVTNHRHAVHVQILHQNLPGFVIMLPPQSPRVIVLVCADYGLLDWISHRLFGLMPASFCLLTCFSLASLSIYHSALCQYKWPMIAEQFVFPFIKSDQFAASPPIRVGDWLICFHTTQHAESRCPIRSSTHGTICI